MSLPVLSPEQRAEALKNAAEARKARADIKARLKDGRLSIKDVIDQRLTNPIIGKTKVKDILTALPKIGPQKAAEIMAELKIASTRRMRGLGERQRRDLLTRFGHWA